MKHTFSAPSASVPAIASVTDYSEDLDALGGTIEVPGSRRIRRSGFYNKASRRPLGGAENYSLKSESPLLVKLVDGTTAVASREGVIAYVERTGQSVPDSL